MKIIESEIKKEGWEVKKVKVKMREKMLGKQTNIFHFLDS